MIREIVEARVDRWIAQETVPTAEAIIADVARFLATAPFPDAVQLMAGLAALQAGITESTTQKGDQDG